MPITIAVLVIRHSDHRYMVVELFADHTTWTHTYRTRRSAEQLADKIATLHHNLSVTHINL